MAVALEADVEEMGDERAYPDPLGFLAGKRYTCYCGRSVIGSTMCRPCAHEMAEHFSAARRARAGDDRFAS